jgi:gluconolactonase
MLVVLLLTGACGGGSDGSKATGGSVGTGGASSTGGASETGGQVGSGGTTPSTGAGGAVSSGGTVAASGGVEASGGKPGSGGLVATGGSVVGGTVGRGGSGGGGAGASVAGGTASGGTSGGGGAGMGGASGKGGAGSGGATGSGGASGAKRTAGACQAGVSYPAPVLTGTPKLLYKPSGTSGSGTYEGPVWLSASSVLLFSDISFSGSVNPSQMWKLTPPSTVATYLADAGVNGMAVDGSGVVYACSHKVQGIVKLDFAGAALTTVVDNVGGKTFNSPNDVVVRSDGTLYFTDPDFQLGNRTSATGKKGVYRVSPDKTVSLVDDTFGEPNGITLSPDETVLYVADYNGNVVRSFAVAADGSTSGRKDFATVSSPDGFAMDCLGNLYVASGTPGAIQVFAPSGTKVGSVTVASSLSNMAFGGADGKTLYITAGKALYSLDMNLPGYYY